MTKYAIHNVHRIVRHLKMLKYALILMIFNEDTGTNEAQIHFFYLNIRQSLKLANSGYKI